MRTFFMCLIMGSLFGGIVEIKNLEDVKEHITPDSVVIFDLDNTLIEPAQDLGSPQWFYHRQAHLCREGASATMALKAVLAEWMAIQNITKVKLVEPCGAEFVRGLQAEGTSVMVLTTRGLDSITCTLDQLRQVGFDMGRAAPFDREFFFDNGEHCLYRRGMLFANGTDHGTALRKFLEGAKVSFKHVVHVNDKMSQLRLVERVCQEDKIPYVGLRYGFLDEKVRNFDPEISERQQQLFGHILSNEEVEKMIIAEAK